MVEVKQVCQSVKDGRITVLDVPPPELRPHGVLVQTAWSVISAGTERAKVELGKKSLLGKARARPDQVRKVVEKVRQEGVLRTYQTVKARLEEINPIGYSCAGIVLAVGELAPGFSVGDRVACGGGDFANHAEVVYVPATLCVRVPDGVTLDEAAFATVGAVALQGVRQAGVSVGDRVAVIGLGLLGLLTVQILAAAGCEVAGVDPVGLRCETALRLGARAATTDAGQPAGKALLPLTSDVGFDAVILTAAARDSGPVELAGLLARDRGTVVAVGDVGLEVPRSLFYEKELTLRLSRSYGPGRYDPLYEDLAIDYPVGYVRWTEQRNMAEFLRLVAQRRVDVRSLVTHRFPVDAAPAAYDLVADQARESLGVLLEYPQAPSQTAPPVVMRKPVPRRCGETVGVSLVGAGNFATATLLPALARDGRFRPRGVCTASGLSARDVAERYGFAFCAAEPAQLWTDAETDAVVIATRHSSHAALACEALRAGKAVFVEKPLALTEDQLDQVIEALRSSGGRLMVGFNRRFSPHAQRAREVLAARTGPATVAIRVNAGPVPATHWTQLPEVGGGRIVGEMCHFVDLAGFLVGAPPVEVVAYNGDPQKSPLLTDTVCALLKYADGSVATIAYVASGDPSFPKERVEVFVDGKVIIIDDFREATLVKGGRRRTFRTAGVDKGHGPEMRAFLDFAGGRKRRRFASRTPSRRQSRRSRSSSLWSPVRLSGCQLLSSASRTP